MDDGFEGGRAGSDENEALEKSEVMDLRFSRLGVSDAVSCGGEETGVVILRRSLAEMGMTTLSGSIDSRENFGGGGKVVQNSSFARFVRETEGDGGSERAPVYTRGMWSPKSCFGRGTG